MKKIIRPSYSTGKYILDSEGNVLPEPDVLKWGEWLNTADRRVAETFVGTTRVSTVFIGLSKGIGNGKPVLWETMVFGGPCDGENDCYTSKELALEGHKRLVDIVKENQPAPPQGILGIIEQFKAFLEKRKGNKNAARPKSRGVEADIGILRKPKGK